MDSWNEAYSDGSDESETLMLEGIRHHQRQNIWTSPIHKY